MQFSCWDIQEHSRRVILLSFGPSHCSVCSRPWTLSVLNLVVFCHFTIAHLLLAQARVELSAAATDSITMINPTVAITGTAAGTAVGAKTGEKHWARWLRSVADRMDLSDFLSDMEKERINASEYLRNQGWHCTACPCVKLTQVVHQKDLMDILQDPIFRKNARLKEWMEQQLKQASKMTPGCKDLENETLDSKQSEDGKFSAIMAELFARVDESTQSRYAQETSQDVCDRLKNLGSNFHPIADLLKADGIDGHFLAHNDISRECLADEYGIRRKIQQDALLSHFGKYKAKVAILLVACSVEISHRWGQWTFPSHMSHEDLKVRAQKMMTYQSVSKLLGGALPALDQSSRAAAFSDQSLNEFEVVDSDSNPLSSAVYRWSSSAFEWEGGWLAIGSGKLLGSSTERVAANKDHWLGHGVYLCQPWQGTCQDFIMEPKISRPAERKKGGSAPCSCSTLPQGN